MDINSGYQQQNNNLPQSQPSQHYKDDEENQGVSDITTMMRVGFIRKVYGILTMQLLLTVVMSALTFIPAVSAFFQANLILFYVCAGLTIALAIPLICCRNIARQVPTNYILLGLWTFCEAYMVATLCSFYAPVVVISAASMTFAVTFALTLYACTTKTDFTFMGGLLFVGVCLLFCLGIFTFVIGNFLNTLYCVLGVFVYSLYLIFDTQLVMGKFGNEFSIDDYIVAALMIYIDIIQIFIYLLQIFGRR